MKENKYWNPSKFDENVANDPNWVKAYGFAFNTKNPFSKKVVNMLKEAQEMEGHIGVRPEFPFGILIVYATENSAKAARNILKAEYGNFSWGREIGELYIPKEYAKCM